ncbi:MAG: hypothetical protein K2Q06_04975 [Parvularculaceae bacterium]|nr:hypothetical protein [Parvularculaceae bacterium]
MSDIERRIDDGRRLDAEDGSRRGISHRLFDGDPVRTLIRLLILSLVVGLLLSIVGLNPAEFWRGIGHAAEAFVRTLGSSAWEIATNVLRYVAFGAAIVVPIWLIIRLLNGRRR